MGVIVNKDNTRNTNLTRRIEADLRQRAVADGDDGDAEIDYVSNSEYTKNLRKTSRFGWVWVVLILLALLSLISILFL